jgi:hypothetical protein
MTDQTSLGLVHVVLSGIEDSTSLVRELFDLVLAMLAPASQMILF